MPAGGLRILAAADRDDVFYFNGMFFFCKGKNESGEGMPGGGGGPVAVIGAPAAPAGPDFSRHGEQGRGQIARKGGAALLVAHHPQTFHFLPQPEHGVDEIVSMDVVHPGGAHDQVLPEPGLHLLFACRLALPVNPQGSYGRCLPVRPGGGRPSKK